jgi:hypothetical protein
MVATTQDSRSGHSRIRGERRIERIRNRFGHEESAKTRERRLQALINSALEELKNAVEARPGDLKNTSSSTQKDFIDGAAALR